MPGVTLEMFCVVNVAGPVQLNVYVGVPPLTVVVAAPSFAELQVAFTTFAVNEYAAGFNISILVVATQPFESVTIPV